MARDWVAWHRVYDDPGSSMSGRLVAVVDETRRALADAPPGPIRVASLCAGDARDLSHAVADHPRSSDVDARVVELDTELAAGAQRRLADLDVRASVVTADAGLVDAVADVVPIDVLMLCGIFGNVCDEDVQATIEAVPMLTRSGGSIIWTRHRRAPDLIGSIRGWFDDAGCTTLSLRSAGPGGWAAGRERFDGERRPLDVERRLFRFRDDLW